MRLLKPICLMLLLIGVMSGATCAGSIAAPPQIMMPYGSDVVTELYFSDSDVLRVVKGMVPMIGDLLKQQLGAKVGEVVGQASGNADVDPSIMASLDLKPLSEAIEGVESVRMLIANYKGKTDKKSLLAMFDSGVKKTGTYKRILSDVQFGGVVAFYVEDKDKGYVAYMYSPENKMIYAARLTGFLDMQKIMGWAMDLIGKFIAIQPAAEPVDGSDPSEQLIEPAPDTAPEEPMTAPEESAEPA